MQITELGEKKYSETKRLIRKAMADRQLVLFVGAGASVDAGMPLWGNAVSQILDKLNLDEKKNLDNLIIPQYYYNARGHKEYTQLMREIFHYYDKLYPGDIQDAIIQFDTETIITTNYDHLIEQAAENNGEFLYVVSQDSDLPYRKAGKELIKIHGDFEHDNFVLKEDDYLHYHKNFKLIENYIKSLIGTKTVLFVGYSLGDPDIKHIFSWVKEILDEHFQRAYLIATGRRANQNEIEYLSHLGVNIIYATELFDEKDISFDNQSAQLLQTLYYFLDDEEKQNGIIDSLYSYLKPLSSLNYTYRKYIESAFNRLRNKISDGIALRIDSDNFITYSSTHDLDEDETFLIELDYAIDGKSKNQKVQTIAEVLRKSSVRGTCREIHEEGQIRFDRNEFLQEDTEVEWVEAIHNFDYKKLDQLKEFNSKILSESKPELYLQQAYICSFLGDYLSSYYCLDNAANYFYRKREFSWYFISVWNKKNIAQLITVDIMYNRRLSANIREAIKNDYDTIDLEKTLKTIPNQGNDNNRFLRDLKDFKFASDLFYDVVSNSVKTSAQAKETYFIFAGTPAYEEMRQQVYDYYKYGIYNCLMVDRYRENNEIFNLFVRSIFVSVSAPDKETSEDSFLGGSGNIHADSLTSMDIHLILRYIDAAKLRKLFNEFNINIIGVNEDGKEYLRMLIDKITPVFDLDLYNGNDIFWRFICFVSHVSLDEKVSADILEALAELNNNEYLFSRRDSLTEIVNAIYIQHLYTNKEICDKAKKLAIKLVNIVSISKDCLQYYKYTIISLLSICQEGGCLFDDEETIGKILSEDYYSLLAEMYRRCSDNVRIIIKELFDGWICPNTGRGYRIYSEIVLAEIIKPSKGIEDKAFDYLADYNAKKKNEQEQGIRTFSEDDLESYLINLFLSNYLINVDKLKEVVKAGNDTFSKWLIDVEGYDYSKFELSWLNRCYPSLLKKLSEIETVRRSIVSVYKEKYSSESIDNRTNEIMIKYFI